MAFRATLALVTALVLTAVPLWQVAACSCGSGPLREIVHLADVAFVGTPVTSTPLGTDELGDELVVTTWEVERARDPMNGSQIDVASALETGMNCGITFGEGERWLILASDHGRGLETSGCGQNSRLDGDEKDPIAAIVVANDITQLPGPEVAPGFQLDIPAPVVGILAATILVAAASMVAFRRASR